MGTGDRNQCQCHSTCKRESLPGKAFCEMHITTCPFKSPLTGWEPNFEPSRWNRRAVRESHNCFSYAMNVNDPKQIQKCVDEEDCEAPFHQPGVPANYPSFHSKKQKTCPNMVMRLLGDNPDLKMTTFEKKCPPRTSKIALVVDPSDDYHFLRQDSSGFWSQKSGARAVTKLDASRHEIWNPQMCDLNYERDGVLNYDVFCGFLCVPRTTALFMRSRS